MEAVRYRLFVLLRRSWRSTAGAAVLVALIGGLVLTLAAGAVRTRSAPDRYVSAFGGDSGALVQQFEGAPRTAELRRLSAVRHAEAASFVFGGLMAPGAKRPLDAIVFAGSSVPMGVRLVEGSQPDPADVGQFVATPAFFRAARAKVGDHFRLVTFTREQGAKEGFEAAEPLGPSFDATLVGRVVGPAELEDSNSAVTVFPGGLVEGDVGVSATLVAVALKPGADLGDLRRQVARLPGGAELFQVQRSDLVSSEIRAAISAQGQGLSIFAAIVAGAALIVIGQLLGRQYRLAEEERAVLASLGFTATQLDAEPAARAAVAVSVGSVAAGGLAYVCSGLFPRGFVRVVEPHPGLRFDPLVQVVGPVALAAGLIAWVLVAAMTHRRRPVEVPLSPRVEKLVTTIPSSPAAMGLWFASTRPAGLGRSARLPLVGLALLVALVFGAFTFGSDLDHLTSTPRLIGADFDLLIGQGGAVTRAQVAPLLGQSAAARLVDGITLYGSSTAGTTAASFNLVGMDPVKGDLLPEVLQGRIPTQANEIALGVKTLDRLHARVGGVVRLRVGTGTRPFTVTGTVLPPPVGGSDLIADAGLVTLDGYRVLTGGRRLNTGTLSLAKGAPADAPARIARALGVQGTGTGDPPSTIVNLRRVHGIPFLVTSVVGALVVLSLLHQLLSGLRRRRRDLAILRAFGASRRWVAAVVHWQATIVTLVVLAFGVPIGIAAGNAVYRAFVGRIGARPDVLVRSGWLLVGAVGVLLLTNVGLAVPAWRSRRLPPTEALAER